MAYFQGTLIAVLSVTVLLGIMIFVHEWGHFIAAKLCGVRVEVFSFGLGPRLFGVKRGDTDYRLSALPFGGYVRMAGDNPVEERTGASYEFLSRPRWQRVVIAVAGPTMNFILAFVIYWGIYTFVGMPFDAFLAKPADVVAVAQDSSATSGMQPGDRILAVNGVRTPSWEKVVTEMARIKPGGSATFKLLRDGTEQSLTLQVPEKVPVFSITGYPALPAVVDDVAAGMPAEKAGLKAGDKIVSMDGKPVVTWQQLVDVVHHSKGQPVQFVVERQGSQIPISVTPVLRMGPDGESVFQVGVAPKTEEDYERQGIVTAAKDAGLQCYGLIRQIAEVIGGLFSGKVSIRDLAGPVGIARVSGQAATRGPMTFLALMAYISLNLGLLNLLPIPILDGGHVLLLAIEGALRRDLSIAVKERFVQVGLVFLLAIFAFVMYSDILKLIQHH